MMEETKIIKKSALSQILERHKTLSEKCYIDIFSFDDKKKQKKIFTKCYNVHKEGVEFFQKEFDRLNKDSYAVFMNFNLLEGYQRLHKNIVKILYIFIDLDDANEEHNNLIKDYLKEIGVVPSYNCKSGHGYHFLIPVDLEPIHKDKVKGFLTYLKNNVCDKVDIATHTNERLLRIPESWHFKDKKAKKLETYYSNEATPEHIESNSKLINDYQEDQRKGVKDIVYQNSLKLDDIFYNTIFSEPQNWNKQYAYLNRSKDRNDYFIKNLGFLIASSPRIKKVAESFISGWEPFRWAAVEGWEKKAREHKTPVLYFELLKWARSNKIDEWVALLTSQTEESFLDEYEIYYLDDEKKESAYLLYYPEPNYYVQKSYPEVLQSIVYACAAKGLDLIKEFNLENIKDWNDKSYNQKQITLISTLRAKIEKEHRLQIVHNMNYCPTEDKFIYHNNKKFFNTFVSTEVWKHESEQKDYHFPHIKELIENLTGHEEKTYEWFIKWLSFIVQNPTMKIPTAIIFQGEPGSGKGTFKNLVLDNIFGNNCQEINQTHLESSFNEYLLGKQIIVANEVIHNENRQTIPNILKNLVTDPELTISRKFKKEIVGKNYTHWIFCTNSDNPIKIDQGDRRYAVFYSPKLKNAVKFVTALAANIDYETKEFVGYLKSLKTSFSEVHEPIMTQAKEDIINLNQDSFARFLEFNEQFNTLHDCYVSVFGTAEHYVTRSDGSGAYILTDKIYLLYSTWCEHSKERGVFSKQMFSRKIANLHIRPVVKNENGSTKRMYNVSDIERTILKSHTTLV